MKKIIIALAALFSAAYISQAQEKKPTPKPHEVNVPQAAKDNFAKTYPDIKIAHWEKENGNWEAEFKKENTRMSAVYNDEGNFMYSETVIKVSDLPKAVMDYTAKNYPGMPVVRAEKMTDDKGGITYEAMVKGAPHLIFDGQGNFLKTEGKMEKKTEKGR